MSQTARRPDLPYNAFMDEMQGAGYAAYPRPPAIPTRAERLQPLADAYIGMSFPFLVTLILAAFLIALMTFDDTGRLPSESGDYIVLAFGCSLPVVGAVLSFFPLRSFAKGAGYQQWTAVLLTLLVPAYMIAVPLFMPGLPTDQPIEVYIAQDILMVALAMLIFPAVRLLVGFHLWKTGLPFRFLFMGKQKILKEIERIGEEDAASDISRGLIHPALQAASPVLLDQASQTAETLRVSQP